MALQYQGQPRIEQPVMIPDRNPRRQTFQKSSNSGAPIAPSRQPQRYQAPSERPLYPQNQPPFQIQQQDVGLLVQDSHAQQQGTQQKAVYVDSPTLRVYHPGQIPMAQHGAVFQMGPNSAQQINCVGNPESVEQPQEQTQKQAQHQLSNSYNDTGPVSLPHVYGELQSPVNFFSSAPMLEANFQIDGCSLDDVQPLTNQEPSPAAHVEQQLEAHVQYEYIDPSVLALNTPLAPSDGTMYGQTQQNDTLFPQNVSDGTQVQPGANETQLDMNNVLPVQQQQQPAPNSDHEVSESEQTTTASQAQSTRSNPVLGEERKIICLNCHCNWWNDTCEGQPCTNCVGSTDCVRPRCPDDAVGTCRKGIKCKMVHKTDLQYYEPYLVDLKQFPNRKGKKADAQTALSVLRKQKA